MNNEFVSYEIALALKELGFDEECLSRYLIVTEWENPTGEILLQQIDCMLSDKNLIKAPLKQQAFKFFRDKHKLAADIRSEHLGYYTSIVNRDVMIRIVMKPVNIFETYEEAESACLDKLIEIIKNK